MNKPSLVAFVIPHKGREQMLIETLNSIANQAFDLSGIQVIVVSQNETHSKAVQEFEQSFTLRILHRPASETISALRNVGVAHSESEFLAFLDADIELSPNWISTMISALEEDQRRVIASAMQQAAHDAPPLERIRTALSNTVVDESVDFLPGRNLFLKRSTFERIEGFPENLVTCEDYYFTHRAHEFGQLFYTSRACYVHLGEDREYSEMFKKEIWRGQSNLQSISGRTIPLNEIPSFIVPIGLLLLLLGAVVTLLLGYDALALAMLIMFLFPLLVYSFRLYYIAADQNISFLESLGFYLLYFPARAIGTIGGIFTNLKSGSHAN